MSHLPAAPPPTFQLPSSLLRGTDSDTGWGNGGVSPALIGSLPPGQTCPSAGLQALTSTVVTMSDLFVRESVTLGPRPLATSVMLSPSAGLHTPTWMDRQTENRVLSPSLSILASHHQAHGLEPSPRGHRYQG